MVTYAIFRDDEELEIVDLTETVEFIMKANPNYDYVTTVMKVAFHIEAKHIVSDETHENIALMFPNARICKYGGEVH